VKDSAPDSAGSKLSGKGDGILSSRITRRGLLVAGAQGAALAAAGGVLAACDSSDDDDDASKVSKGGTLTVGMIGGGTAETVSALVPVLPVDALRTTALFDQLWATGPDVASVVPLLAESHDATPDAKTWTIHLREGVEWHDGSPLVAEDLVWTLNAWSKPTSAAKGSIGDVIDFKGVRKVGPRSVEVPLKLSMGQFPTLVSIYAFAVIKNGSTLDDLAQNPIGTGPYKFKSFTPGQESVFDANPNYWRKGPSIDRLVVQSSFREDTALVNALLSGAVQIVPNVTFLIAKQQEDASGVKVQSADAPNAYYFSMRVDKAPFDDVRVRQAMRLIADRPALIEGALAGYGTVGNDLMGEDAEYFAADLTREQDIEQAKSLLRSAGQEGLQVTMEASSASPGMLEAGTLYAQQAKAAGVTVNVKNLDPANYYTDSGGWLTRVFGQNKNGISFPSLTSAYLTQLWSKAPYNDGHWGSQPGQEDKLLFDAIAALEPADAQEKWNEVQRLHFDEGPYILWANANFVDLLSDRVRGVETTPAGPLNNYDLSQAGLA
jgi:peptide/nickel transport system substrate-binding protein